MSLFHHLPCCLTTPLTFHLPTSPPCHPSLKGLDARELVDTGALHLMLQCKRGGAGGFFEWRRGMGGQDNSPCMETPDGGVLLGRGIPLSYISMQGKGRGCLTWWGGIPLLAASKWCQTWWEGENPSWQCWNRCSMWQGGVKNPPRHIVVSAKFCKVSYYYNSII